MSLAFRQVCRYAGSNVNDNTCFGIILRSWRNNIRSKVSTPNQLEVYQTLFVLESELNETVFGELIQLFVQHWEQKEPTFIKYFQEHYCNRTGM